MNLSQKLATDILTKDDKFRMDSHIVVTKVVRRFQELFGKLAEKTNYFRTKVTTPDIEVLADEASFYIRLHWAICIVSKQATSERLEEDTRLLDHIRLVHEVGSGLDTILEGYARHMEELKKGLPKITRTSDVRPVTGCLAMPPKVGRIKRTGGNNAHHREVTGRELVDRFLYAHSEIA